MENNRYLLGLAFLLVGAIPAFSQVSNDNEDEVYKTDTRVGHHDYVPGQVLVKFKDDSPVNVVKARGMFKSVNKATVDAVLKDYGVETMDKLLPNAKPLQTKGKTRGFNGQDIEDHDLSQLYLIETDEVHANQSEQLANSLNALDEVEYAEPNYKVYLTDDKIADSFDGNPLIGDQWYLEAYGVKQLWNKPIINPKRPVIAILDTGVDMTHPDLEPNLWTNTAEAEGESGYDNDGNGFAGDVHGWDFINNTPDVRDNNMHGTHVAGIAAAANNGIGIIGANPKALIMPITVMQSDGTGDVATIVKGIDYAAANGATILNLSLGTYANSRVLRQALEKAYQTAVIVAAAGNDGKDINGLREPEPMFPAGYSFVLGVQAIKPDGKLAIWSNFDPDGNTYSMYSTLQDPDGFNYELKAPGIDMLSTVPGGQYKVLYGTSMAAPLVAGAISALKMVKNYDTQEILWGDLLHTDNIAQAYDVTNRPAELDIMKFMLRERKELVDETEEDYSGDNEIDAGETVSLYPVIRTTFGEASNIKIHLEMGEYEDPNTVQIITDQNNKVAFGMHLDAYGKGVSLNPLKVKIADNVADNRHIKMKIVATCDETSKAFEKTFTMIVNNMVKINGLISEDRTLTADHVYFVNENLGIMEGVTLTIEPGTRLEFGEGTSLQSFSGKLVAKGTPEKPIIFTNHIGVNNWDGIKARGDTISFCKISGVDIGDIRGFDIPYMKDCLISDCQGYLFQGIRGKRITFMDCADLDRKDINLSGGDIVDFLTHCNFINNISHKPDMCSYSQLIESNYFHNPVISNYGDKYDGKEYLLGYRYESPHIDKSEHPSYLGTSREDIIRPYLFEFGNALNTWGQIDLSNMPTRPISEAHGIVWKVCVNGKDAQDEYEDLAPLGVGKHKFEVYYNRPMNKAVIPQIAFGVREPYTQNGVTEDGSWNEEGTIYTAYKTIDGRTKSDGVNRIYVWGAEDNEYFECPYEKTRFNVMINVAGSMATGFAAEAGLGRVDLTWNNENNDFEDAMGFNIYRYTLNEEGEADTIRINQEIVNIETTAYTDFNVTPGQTYYYMYKVLSTDLKEYDISNVVAATPLTSTLGDANGSGDVDVADVITTVNYAAGKNPKPFIFEAADVNVDLAIDILDVVGIIQKVLNPVAGVRAMTEVAATAEYSIEDGILYVDTPIDLGGVQVMLNLDPQKSVTVSDDLVGFEHTSAWLSENDYMFMAYNMNGKALSAGKHALLRIGDAEVSGLILSTIIGEPVNIHEVGGTTAIETVETKTQKVNGVFNLKGHKMADKASDLEKLPKGIYIIDGEKVVK